MRARKLSILFATAFTMSYSTATANNEPKGPAVTSFKEVDSNTIYYGMNKIYPNNIQMSIITKYLDELRNNPDTYIKVTSHTDDVGDWETNLNVSKKRALVIADYLREYGVPQDRIIVDWLGEDAPMYFSTEDKHKNRRTNIRIIKKVKFYPQAQQVASVSDVPSVKQTTYTIRKGNETTPEPTTVVSQKSVVATQPTPAKEYRRVAKAPAKPKVYPRVAKAKESVEAEAQQEEFTAKSPEVIIQKSVVFIDASSKQPVQVEVDLNTSKGKTSVSTSEKGELKVNVSDLKKDYLDVYAYGYFFKSTKIESGSGIQVIELQPTNSGKKVELNNLQFVPGKAILLSESNAELERLYLSLMMNPQQRIEVGGHINVPGKTLDELTNKQMQLSIDRAKAVYDYLVKKGISKKRLAYKGYGNSEMIFPDPQSDVEKSRNRRVEVKILD